MVIREYLPSDFPRVEALWKVTGIYTEERGDTHGIIEQCNARGGKFLVMEDPRNSRITGTSWMTYDGRRVYLHHFSIDPSYQGKGLGRKLALKSLEVAESYGCPVKLEVHQKNHIAVNLYKSLGFFVFEDYDIYMIMDPGTALEAGPTTDKEEFFEPPA